jgi:hypothetical protein
MMGGASLVIVDIDLSSWTLLLVIDSLESFMFYLLPNLSAQLLSYWIVVIFGPKMQTLAEGISRIFIIL